jgi:TIM-barrel protein
MAGITNGAFCRSMAMKGFDMVTLGGYNADHETIEAGCHIWERGRPEFLVEEEDLISVLESQVSVIKELEWDGMVSINLRSITPDPIIEISKLNGVDVVEINAHCRQPEIIRLGVGQALMKQPKYLEKYTKEVVKGSKCKVSVKIRANVTDVDTIQVSRCIDRAGADFLHVDAMKPGFNSADYKIINSIKNNTSNFLIGNNSVKDIESARKMLAAGADGVSIARAIMGGSLKFDLSLV